MLRTRVVAQRVALEANRVPVAKYLARIERSELRAEHAFVRLLFGFALVEEAA